MKVMSQKLREFWDRVEASQTDECLEWPGFRNRHGYGECRDGRFPTHLAHRISYLKFKGDLGPDQVVDHLCRNPACVNPRHLEAVTQKINIGRGEPATRTHCPRGHPYDEENTARRRNGARSCRACKSAYDRKRYREKHQR